MNKNADLPNTIAIFPLGGALLLPRARLPLHIFEPRYLQMIEDALKTDERLIGMIQPNEAPGRKGNGLQCIGCAGRITQFSETEDGRYMITLGGMSRFRVVKEVEGFSPYRKCDVSWDGFERDLGNDEQDSGFDRESFLALLNRYFDAQGLSADWDTMKEADDELLINSLSMMLDLDLEGKQALLEAPSLETRRETLITLIEFSLRGGMDEGFMQ
ncbi:ATP-dependent protease [Sulfitobacter sp. M57]|nr:MULTISPECIES: LON peptidase substrate-binding domain-containing protein [unclassified Sulfitobacter]MDF3415343.1 ATP-dependent protease [Sulfitobacter sp. KE5]MDF3422824.1 ATP-dependent protease [Sulfitobacter sp. KE43]MDF3433889.1 ATP-dependent protease [Sulfitobacter sp. KE42]MDF3459529.1 ATP-dependent protease [Sulfitobacter sp. S74]MDF3463428.1 ATP-dependent protease [Sulfitobacter sp. Ks18]